MTNKKIALIDLMGGLGNQLHQLIFANYLEKNDFDVYVNDKWFKPKSFIDGTTKRDLEVSSVDFGLKMPNKMLFLKFQTLDKFLRNPFFKKFYNSKFNKLYRLHTGSTFNKDNIKKYNWFKGYWQSGEYLAIDKSEIINFLKKDKNFVLENNYNANTLVHIRKGDYVSWGEDSLIHIILNLLIF